METLEKSVEVINDLIELNNDRVKGFEKATEDLSDKDADLKALFLEYAQQSRSNSAQLKSAIATYNSESGTSVSAALHRAWIDVRSLFTGKDREDVLSECERGEDAIKKAYQDALAQGTLSGELFATVSSQSQQIQTAHDRIKALRNSAA